jgi:hypothetical protein
MIGGQFMDFRKPGARPGDRRSMFCRQVLSEYKENQRRSVNYCIVMPARKNGSKMGLILILDICNIK